MVSQVRAVPSMPTLWSRPSVPKTRSETQLPEPGSTVCSDPSLNVSSLIRPWFPEIATSPIGNPTRGGKAARAGVSKPVGPSGVPTHSCVPSSMDQAPTTPESFAATISLPVS